MPYFGKKPCTSMINYTPASQRNLSLFRTPFEQKLDPNNRWVKMAELVPWDNMAKVFFDHMSPDQGRTSIDLRIVLGALLVKHIEGLSDEDTIRYIQENIYAQYFVGLPSFQTEPVFVPSLFVEIRKRLGKNGAIRLNDQVLAQAQRIEALRHRPRRKATKKKPDDNQDQDPPQGTDANPSTQEPPLDNQADTPTKRGTLKMDASVAPQHIGYPTDTRLLAEARQYSEELIDKLYYGSSLWSKKPRTYRREAHKQYLAFSKKRSRRQRDVKRTRGKQLRYLRRNLKHLDCMLDELQAASKPCPWKHRDWQRLWVIRELYRQQDIMHRDKRRRIDDRIVNIAQPYVRPIKRGKAGKETEFGAKLNLSETEGFVRVDQVDFDNFNEGIYLIEQVEAYKALYGYYPELVLVDKIYLNRKNRKYLKDTGIKHSGPPLGRQPEMSKYEKQKRKKEQNKRSEIEGKFGQAKSKYGLDDIKTRRADTSYACIILILMALNIIKLERALFSFFSAIIRAFVWQERPFVKCEGKHRSKRLFLPAYA
jgi:hypothetical protein